MKSPAATRHHRPISAARGSTPLAGHWIDGACAHLTRHAALVRVTVVALRGSAPREPGASMLVDDSGMLGTIGGGRLEWHAARAARRIAVRERFAARCRSTM